MDIIDTGKAMSCSEEQIDSSLRMFFDYDKLSKANEYALDYKRGIDYNEGLNKQQVIEYCAVQENTQYKAIMEGFMSSTTTSRIHKDIEFLRFALKIMEERNGYKGDIITPYYDKVKDVLGRLSKIV